MQFNSLTFLIFFGCFLLAWPLFARKRQAGWVYLCVASFVFYGFWDWRFLSLIVASGLIDYAAAYGIYRCGDRVGKRRLFLALSVGANLLSLAVFKYLGFGVESLNGLLHLFGAESKFSAPDLILPVGISFYTFQSMSYTIDVYLGRLQPCRNVFHFFAYLSLFPQLVAGPIERASNLLPQLAQEIRSTRHDRWVGLKLIATGLFKKTVVADTLAASVNQAYAGVDAGLAHSTPFWWLVAVFFALQIYCDFSGYTDIARGLARWIGLRFGQNFDHPYTSIGFSDFWSRWHISLSTWFRDYLYIPLGGSRASAPRVHVNIWITMLVSGLWHGASAMFICWGAFHALQLSLERATNWPKWFAGSVPARLVGVIVTFTLVSIGWVLFRAQSVAQAADILGSMLWLHTEATLEAPGWREVTNTTSLMWSSLLITHELFVWARRELAPLNWLKPSALLRIRLAGSLFEPLAVGLMLASSVFFRGDGQAFLYFQF